MVRIAHTRTPRNALSLQHQCLHSMSSILLKTLADDLEPSLRAHLLGDSELQNEAQSYLSRLLVNDNLLSTDNFSTNTADSPDRQKTLTEEIAELDQEQNLVSKEMAAQTDTNRDLIVGISRNLDDIKLRLALGIPAQLDEILQIVDGDDTSERLVVPANERLEESIRSNDVILANIDSVLDFLELPTFCKLCISQGNYQESLEISILVQSLRIRFPKFTIFQRINRRVDIELEIMAKGLVKLLNTNLKQNQILKIFQILNRLNLNCIASSSKSGAIMLPVSHEDPEQKNRFLKLIYLNGRFRFILKELDNLAPLIRFNRLTYLKRFVETYREHIFSSLSIYYTIFANSDTESSTNDDKALIYQYVKNLALRLVSEIKEYFPQIQNNSDTDDYAEKDGFVLQVIYLCKSVAKFGANFETILMSELCYRSTSGISAEDWERNSTKVDIYA